MSDKRPKSEKRQKTEMVAFRVTPGQHRLLSQMAEASGMSLAEWLRQAVLYWLDVEALPEAISPTRSARFTQASSRDTNKPPRYPGMQGVVTGN
jgi:uncharacterized protein (DUF1778 family)